MVDLEILIVGNARLIPWTTGMLDLVMLGFLLVGSSFTMEFSHKSEMMGVVLYIPQTPLGFHAAQAVPMS